MATPGRALHVCRGGTQTKGVDTFAPVTLVAKAEITASFPFPFWGGAQGSQCSARSVLAASGPWRGVGAAPRRAAPRERDGRTAHGQASLDTLRTAHRCNTVCAYVVRLLHLQLYVLAHCSAVWCVR